MTPITESKETQTVLLNRLLSSAVVLSWDELMPESTSGLIHIEYQTGDDGSLDFVKIWASTVWGEWKLVCELWMRPLWSHVTGIRFGGNYRSVEFARTLELVVDNENEFLVTPNLRGLVQVYPPNEEERREAERLTLAALSHHGYVPSEKHFAA
jgi:hypothetical protein